ncbi:MAG: 4Fe-4S binding protein [Methanothrix sp.]|nr:4Fe-4S binding protein [Methanothrix sp.]
MIQVDADRCIGCLSCSNVCPSKKILLEEAAGNRTISWKRCGEECDLCVEFCPAGALRLVPLDESAPEPSVTLRLASCSACGATYAAEPMLAHVESSIPSEMKRDAAGLSWVRECPACRRWIEAERASAGLARERRIARRGL